MSGDLFDFDHLLNTILRKCYDESFFIELSYHGLYTTVQRNIGEDVEISCRYPHCANHGIIEMYAPITPIKV